MVLCSLEGYIGCKMETVTDELRSQSTIVRCACTRSLIGGDGPYGIVLEHE